MKQRHITRRMSGSFLIYLLAITLILFAAQGTLVSHAHTSAYAAEDTQLTALQLQQAIEEAQQAYTDARENADEAAKRIAEQEEHIKHIEDELIPAQQERLGASTREMYKYQQNGFGIINALLGSGSLRDFINQWEYITRVADKHHTEMVRLMDLKQELEDSRTELRAAQEEADRLVDETYTALDAAQEAQAEAMRRIEEEARREATLAANGGHLVAGDRTNDETAANMPPASETAPPSSTSSSDSGSSSQGGSSGNNAGNSASQFTPPPQSSDSLDGWAARIDAYLAGSPLAGQGYTFASAALNCGIDPRFSPAIACTESGKGRYCFLPHNAWGWGSASWGSWEEAINAHVSGLARLYGSTVTVEGAKMYCPPNWQHWYNMVSSQMALI